MAIYISKPGTWFDAGKEVECEADFRPDGMNAGIFSGYHLGKLDEEMCGFDEFEELDAGQTSQELAGLRGAQAPR